MAKLKVKLVKSTIGCKQPQKDTVRALGLKKLQSEVIKDDNPAIRGQIFKVKHLVEVHEIKEGL